VYIYVGIRNAKFATPVNKFLRFSLCDENENEEFESDDVCGVCGVAGCSWLPSKGEGSTPPIQGCHCQFLQHALLLDHSSLLSMGGDSLQRPHRSYSGPRPL